MGTSESTERAVRGRIRHAIIGGRVYVNLEQLVEILAEAGETDAAKRLADHNLKVLQQEAGHIHWPTLLRRRR